MSQLALSINDISILFSSIFGVIGINSLLLYFVLRNKVFVHYCIMIFGLSAHISLPLFRENYFLFVSNISIITATVASIGGLLFTQSFVGITRAKYSSLALVYKVILIAGLVVIGCQLVNMVGIGSKPIATNLSYVAALVALATSVLNFSIGFILWKREMLARLYLFTNLPMILSAIAYTIVWFLQQNQLISEATNLRFIIYIGMTIQMVLFSVFIGYKIQKAEKRRLALEHGINKKLKEEVKKQTRSLLDAVKEVEIQRNELKEVNELKNKLFSLVAHDLRNPLQNLASLVDLIGDHSLEPEKLEEFTRQVKIGLSQSHLVMERLLFWSSKQLEGIRVQRQNCDLAEIIEELKNELATIAQSKRIDIQAELRSANVFFDRDMLRVVIRNLLSNAIKFSYERGKIKITTKEGGGSTEIRIIDQGIGMNPQWYDELIQKGKPEVKMGTKGEKGSGFGLLITKDFVEMNEGTFDCESEKDSGTSFIIRVPISSNLK